MPADRSDRASEASTTAAKPYVRTSEDAHAQRRANVMPRGAACLSCKTRKVKCDGVRPICGSCKRSAKAHKLAELISWTTLTTAQEDVSTIVCTFEDDTSAGKGKKPATSGAAAVRRVAELEETVARLEAQLARQPPAPTFDGPPQPFLPQPPPPPSFQRPYAGPPGLAASGFGAPSAFPQSSPFAPTYHQPAPGPPPMSTPSSAHILQPISPPTAPFVGVSSTRSTLPAESHYALLSTEGSPGEGADAMTPDAELRAILTPGWPADMPPFPLAKALLETWFDRPHFCAPMVNRGRFLAAFTTLPPSSPAYPSFALIHAMLALSCSFVSEDFAGLSNESYWRSSSSAAEHHSRAAKRWIDDSIVRGAKLFQVAQAIVQTCFTSYASARFVEVWLYSGLAIRVGGPLGLTHLDACSLRPGSGVGATLLDPPIDEAERYERSMTWWLSYCADKFVSANTSWAGAIMDEDVTTHLPNESLIAGPLQYPRPHADSLSPQSPSFFVSHAPTACRAIQLMFKSVILLSRALAFIQRAPYPIGSVLPQSGAIDPPDDGSYPDLRQDPAFKRIDADVVSFRLSMPRDMRSLANSVDAASLPNLVLAHTIPHLVTIILYEPFATTAPNDSSFVRCLTSARAILATIHSTPGIAAMAPMAPFFYRCFSTAGRTLVADLALRELANDTAGAHAVRQEIDVLMATMTDNGRNSIGVLNSSTLRAQLANPASVLPRKFGSRPVHTTSFCEGQALDSRPETPFMSAPFRYRQGNAGQVQGHSTLLMDVERHLSSRPTTSSSTPVDSDALSTWLLDLERVSAGKDADLPAFEWSDQDLLALFAPVP